MSTFTRLVTFLSLGLAAFASPTPRAAPGGYIVKLKSGVDAASHQEAVQSSFRGSSEVKYTYDSINAYAGTFSEETIEQLRNSEEVEYVEPDVYGGIAATVTQSNTVWGLQRISQPAALGASSSDASLTTWNYVYDSAAGSGVDVYVIDTGIKIDHTEFEGRARWGATFGGYADVDAHGHGSHCAGTVGGKTYGVAKKANLIAVRTINNSGGGLVSDTIAAVQWVIQQAAASGRPSVISMSLGFPPTQALDDAATAAINAGVHFAAASGNDYGDAANKSPARAAAILTVGASDITDTRASFSNTGSLVDVHAPGVSVISVGISSTTATASLSGTSMATPHVAGYLAYLISLEGNMSAPALQARVKALAISGVLKNIPSGTANLLINNRLRG